MGNMIIIVFVIKINRIEYFYIRSFYMYKVIYVYIVIVKFNYCIRHVYTKVDKSYTLSIFTAIPVLYGYKY